MFYGWFWFYGMSWAGISRVPLWHPWAEFFKSKNEMAARYFKVKYNFLRNEARNKCNTSFSCDFDWAIHFFYSFYDSRSSLRSKSQFQGQISKKCNFYQIKLGTCVIPLLYEILSENAFMALFSWSQVIFKVESHFQGQKQNGRQLFQGQIALFNKWS